MEEILDEGVTARGRLSGPDQYIVAIGASAGGLEAIHELFDNMPANPNLSFIVIQHLSPDYKSLLVELLSKHTPMNVFEAGDGMIIRRECIYVIPNKKLMTVRHGKLHLVEKVQEKAPNTAIDHFLYTLAAEKKDKSIAVILSGTGTDGTRGIEAIKAAGGMVIVQDPVTAKFDGMPNSAVASGNADFILPPEMIPEEIFHHIKQDPVNVLNKGRVDDQLLNEVFSLIYKTNGYDFHFYKTPTIIRRIAKRMGQRGVTKLPEYVALLRENGEEVKKLSKDFLIGVTRFFRDQPAFDCLYNDVLPLIVSEKADDDFLKVWICACSTGEEAYSVAILIDQYLQRSGRMLEVKIFATDIEAGNIDFASKNCYALSISKDIDPEILKKYFIKEGNHYSVIPRIRKQIVFARHNVIKDPPFIKNDLVSCRNMLIYMNNVLQQKVIGTLHFSVKQGGFLFLGPSESTSTIRDGIDEISSKWKIYRKIGKNKTASHELYRPLENRSAYERAQTILAKQEHKKGSPLQEDFADSIVEDFGYVCFYIDKNYEIKESAGNFNKFLSLPDKKLTLNILKMVPQELSIALNTAIRKCWKENVKVFIKSVRVKQNEGDIFLTISIRPPQPLDGKPYTLLVFGQNSFGQASLKEEVYDHTTEEQSDYIFELEAELSETRNNLQMAVEGLETANEELQSSNEELLSANEELQSSNEELQSLNEELHTLNTEHQIKIRELIELNDDLNNYFRSIDIGQIFLDSNLCIRKFNSAAVRLVNLIETDIGRPFAHISTNIRHQNLLQDIERVLNTDESIEREVLLNNENRCLMRLLPYIRQDKKSDGVIITFVDISAISNLNNIINGVFNSSLSAILAFRAVRNADNRIEDFALLTHNYASEELLDNVSLKAGIQISKLTPIIPEGFFGRYVKVVDSNTPLHTELMIEGEVKKWFQVVAVKMMDGFVVTFTDISEKRIAEQKLRSNYNELLTAREKLRKLNFELEDKVAERTRELSASEERFRLVSNATNDAIWDWNLVGNQIWWSDSFTKLFGYKDLDAFGSAEFWLGKIHTDERETVKSSIYGVINSGQTQWNAEYRFEKADGTYAVILDRGFVLHDESGTPYRMLGSMLDITTLKEAERRVIKSESRFKKVFESSLIGIVFTDDTGRVINANKVFLELTGYTENDLNLGLVTWDRITPAEAAAKNKWAAEQLRSKGVCPPFENEYVCKDGKRISVLLGAASVSEDEAMAVTYIIDITEKKAAEQKELELQKIIKKQQDEFRGIFMNAPALISIRRGEDLKVEFVNQAVIDYFGRNDLHGKVVGELNQEYGIEYSETDDIIKQVYRTGRPHHASAYHIRYDKNRNGVLEDAWFDFVYQPVFDGDGRVDGVASFAFDVTEMIKANIEIKQSVERFKFLADAIPQKVWTAAPDGRGNYFNRMWLDYTGKTQADLIEWNWINWVHPDDQEANRQLWAHSIKTGENFEMERRLRNRKGEYRWHLSRCVPQKDHQGQIVLWVGTSTDIQEQKAISEALKESEDYFRQLADQSPFMIWKVDKEGYCNYVNSQWISFTGMTFSDSVGQGWGAAFHPDDAERENKKFMTALESRSAYHSKFRVKSAKGDYHWVLAQANPIAGPTFDGYIGSLTDITEQELAQQAMKLLMHKKDEFMSIASHELKTPITSMKASLQIAERLTAKKVEVEKIQSFIEKANKQVNRLTSLVEDLLDVTKIQAGKLQFDKVEFNIDEAIIECLDQVQNESAKHRIVIQGDKGITVFGDKHRLEQVIINFLSNAIKYSPEADQVLLKVVKNGSVVRVDITDFGIGIPKDKINFVFDRFFRVQESSQKFSGLGLGLFISAEIIRRHKGEVGVISEEGKGSTFWFSLPTIPSLFG